MTASRDPDPLIGEFLAEGRTELPDRAYDEVRNRIDRTRQRVVIGPWRTLEMPTLAKAAIAAAAVVVAVMIGANLLAPTGPTTGGPGPSTSAATAAASTAASASPAPSAPYSELSPDGGDLAPGTYLFDDLQLSPVPFTFTVPAGWTSLAGSFFGTVGFEGQSRTLNVQMAPWIVHNLSADLCQWQDNDLQPPVGDSAEDLAEALVAQAGKDAVGPTDVTIGGYPAKKVELVMPRDLAIAECDDGKVARWSRFADGYPHTYGAEQRNVMYIIDTPAGRLVIDTSILPQASSAERAELEQVIDSIDFTP
jgi:hypothetical protein